MREKSNNRSRHHSGGEVDVPVPEPAPEPAPAPAPAPVPVPEPVPAPAAESEVLENTSISQSTNQLVKQALSPTPEPAVKGEPVLLKLGSQVIPIHEEEIDIYIKQKEQERFKKYREEYIESKKQKTFLESLRSGKRSGSAVCVGFAIIFMMEFNKFLKAHKDDFCKEPNKVYEDLLQKVITYMESYITPDGVLREILHAIIKASKVIGIILTIFSLPLIPLCATGKVNTIVDVVTVVIGIIAENLCTTKRIEIKATIKEIFHRIRNTKLSNLYPGATIRMMGKKLKNLRNITRHAFSKEGFQEFRNATKTRTQNFKNRVSGVRNKVSGLFRRKQQSVTNNTIAPKIAIGGRYTRKNSSW